MYFSAGSPFGESSVVTVMIVPGSWHSTDGDFLEEPAELEGKDLMPGAANTSVGKKFCNMKNNGLFIMLCQVESIKINGRVLPPSEFRTYPR